jgi:hypothetical protein
MSVLTEEPCFCGGVVKMQPANGGTLSGICSKCRKQSWVRSPAGVGMWHEKLGGAPAARDNPAPEKIPEGKKAAPAPAAPKRGGLLL